MTKQHYALPNKPKHRTPHWVILGSELSPFTLKVLNYFSLLGIDHQFYYRQGSTWGNLKIQIRKMLLVLGVNKLTVPKMTEDDEFPLVPFVFGPNGENMYDSTAVAEWLDCNPQSSHHEENNSALIPNNNSRIEFLVRLIDEYADDFGLYMVHHNRWKVAAIENNAGTRLGQELSSVAGPFGKMVDLYFSARQTRRLPYLFSVAPKGFSIKGVKASRQPPSHLDFPETHSLLETAFDNLLAALETIFSNRPYLFGDCYTLADASLYGQLAMNLPDPEAAELIKTKAPRTYQWLNELAQLDFSSHQPAATAQWFDDLQPLLDEIERCYVPLMNDNAEAVERYEAQGISCFNEKAFDKNTAIFGGEIDGKPYQHVAKSFQRKTWRALQNKAQSMTNEDKNWLQLTLPRFAGDALK